MAITKVVADVESRHAAAVHALGSKTRRGRSLLVLEAVEINPRRRATRGAADDLKVAAGQIIRATMLTRIWQVLNAVGDCSFQVSFVRNASIVPATPSNSSGGCTCLCRR